MPFLAPIGAFLAANAPAIGAAAAIAGAGTTIGNTIYQDMNMPSGQPSPSSPPPPTAAQNIAAEVAKRQQQALLVRQQQPGLVANTGGSLSDQTYQTESSQMAGIPGAFGAGGVDLNSILKLLGGSSGGPPTDLMSVAAGSSGGSIT
jgi:hypothetical protein